MPEVSVIVPLYNCRAYIGAALDSLLAQTFSDFEAIVVDDGSDDGGGDIAFARAQRDPRIVCVHQENAGCAAARNTGIAASNAPYIAFLDADDLWLPDKLARQLPLLRENAVIHAGAHVVADDGRPVGSEQGATQLEPFDDPDPFASLLECNGIAVLTTIVPKALLLAHGCFDTSLRSAEDYDLWLRLAAAGVDFVRVPAPLANYRLRPGSLSSDPVWMATQRLRVYEKLGETVRGGAARAVARRARRERHLLAGELRRRGWATVEAGDLAGGRSDLVRSVRTAPRWWRSWTLAAVLATPFGLRALLPRARARELRR